MAVEVANIMAVNAEAIGVVTGIMTAEISANRPEFGNSGF